MKREKLFGIVVAVLLITTVSITLVNAQGPTPKAGRAPTVNTGTAFTYQGQLKNNGVAVNGNCDFGFRLYDAASSGTQIGSVISTTIPVANGLFSAPLDFGANAINGDARWLDIQTRCGGGAFAALTRQALTPAPIALALPGMYTQQNATSPNVIGGYSGNLISPMVEGGSIGGGGNAAKPNKVTDNYGFVGGGRGNQAGNNTGSPFDSSYATIGGGDSNIASGASSTVGGGSSNLASNVVSTVGGGDSNIASGASSTVGGGGGNIASFMHSTVGGGANNHASGLGSIVAGGDANTASQGYSSVGGGQDNTASGGYSTISGGYGNTASGYASVVGGGGGMSGLTPVTNTASASWATVSGGLSNTASGDGGTVPGGNGNLAGGVNSFAAGTQAHAQHNGSFVWGDGTYADVASTGDNQFVVRAAGGLRLAGAGINTSTSMFMHQVSTGNSCASQTYSTVINNPLTNGDSGAILVVTPNYGSNSSPYVVAGPAKDIPAVYYDASNSCGRGAGKWVIYNLNSTAMVNGSVYNVFVIKP